MSWKRVSLITNSFSLGIIRLTFAEVGGDDNREYTVVGPNWYIVCIEYK